MQSITHNKIIISHENQIPAEYTGIVELNYEIKWYVNGIQYFSESDFNRILILSKK